MPTTPTTLHPRDVLPIDQYIKAKRHNRAFNQLMDAVKAEITSSLANEPRLSSKLRNSTYCLNLLITNVILVKQSIGATGFHLSLSNNTYSNNLYANEIIGIDTLRNAIHFLKESELITADIPSYQGGRTQNRTIIKPTNKLNQLLDQNPDVFRPDGYTREDNEFFLVLKNENKKPMQFTLSRNTTRMQAKLKKINKFITSQNLNLCLSDVDYRQLHQEMLTTQSPSETIAAQDEDETRPVPLDFNSNRLYRIFNMSSFTAGGRYYRAWWQKIPSEYRKYITINGQTTIEVDFKSLCVSLAYAKVGLEKPDGEGYLPTGFDEQYRGVFKFLLVRALGAERNVPANAEDIAEEGGYPPNITYWDCMRLLERKHPRIKHLFFTGVARELQFQDSQVAEKIMLKLMEESVAVLPIHDSFIVDSSYRDLLIETMKNCYVEIIGERAPRKDLLTADTDYQLGRQRVIEAQSNQSLFTRYYTRHRAGITG